MSYRTWVNDYQIFENNGYCRELIDELKRQGMAEPDDGCYQFKVKDINPVIKIVDMYFEKEIKDREKRGIKMYDFKKHGHITSDFPLHLKVAYLIEDAWLFQSYNFVDYLRRTGCIKRVDDTLNMPVYEIKKPVRIRAG
jgi:hypothetical protein